MMIRSSSKLSVWLGSPVWAAFLWVALLSPRSFGEEGVTVALKLEEANYSFLNWSVASDLRSEPFPQEPVAEGKTLRGTLRFGNNSSNAIPFLWQRGAGKLFLDLNRNRDLTDDAAGVWVARETGSDRYQTFNGVRLPLVGMPGGEAQLVDLSFFDYGSQLHVSAAWHSFLQGRLALNGTDWQVGVIPNPFDHFDRARHLLLRPWKRHDQPFTIGYEGSLEAMSFPSKVFAGNQLYQCEFVNAEAEKNPAQLRFTEETVALGDLQITGHFIQRLVLEGGNAVVVLDQPAGTVRVPVGDYTEAKVWLKNGDREAFRSVSRRPGNQRIVVQPDQVAVLVAGGPLTNSVSIVRRGRNLVLNYALVGAGGESYQIASPDYSHPPQFAVFDGDTRIDSGNFEYG